VLTLPDIHTLFTQKGGEMYSGEPVTQLQHALQTAHLAQQQGGDDELVTACLLHDLGHLLHDLGATPTLRGIDDVHQYAALPFLRGLFSARVLGAIQGHVDAKRYLCATRPHYYAALSADSKRSLVLQGGVFDEAQVQAFIAKPGAHDAVQLRLCDDLAKDACAVTPTLEHFMACAARCSLTRAAHNHLAHSDPAQPLT
jgi:phosphonate degradation associated HDIG domain protein